MIWSDIQTERMAIRRILIDHCDTPLVRDVVGWINNPAVVLFSELRHKRHTVLEQEMYIMLHQGADLYLGLWLDDSLIGTMTAHIDEPNKVVNVGILIGDQSKRGQGLGGEAWKAVCDQLLKNGYRKIEAGCMSCNRPMMSICSRYGMMEEGRQEDHFLYRDNLMDLVHWGKLK
jgi:RimJ/RimL family protein N-acetyltransferase